jgi:4-hydroxythreonine-4-phosphate dehydrogenase
MMKRPTIAITTGEPAGIGPDICAFLAKHAFDANLVFIGDQNVIASRAKQRNLTLNITPSLSERPTEHLGNGSICLLHTPVDQAVISGTLNPKNSPYVLQTLIKAVEGCINQQFDAMVTAPVHKGIINDADIAFTGHTEFLAALTHTPKVVMMLVGGGMRVALATIHLALKDVPSVITKESLESTIRILHTDLIKRFGIANPRILVAGLNPHAGEDGYLGREEIEIINPVLAKLRLEGINLVGALPADTLFAKHHLANADAVLAMYHDQGLPVLKHASFGGGVNVTLGLPIIRTSVDHGTALDLAGKGEIEIGSMVAAIDLAIKLASKSSNNE